MGLETAFLGQIADPGKRKVREVEGGPLPAAEHRQHCFRQRGLALQRATMLSSQTRP